MNNLSIGLLELGYRKDTVSLAAVQQILDYACLADSLNFSRFWLAEHHNPNVSAPFTNPEVLISLVAGMTDNIRVGSAGTLVKMYAPYSTVTNFKLLNNLFFNRIDLGLSKSEPSTAYTRDMLVEVTGNKLFESKVEQIYSLLYEEQWNFDKKEVVIPPFGGEAPEVWYLSNSYSRFEDAIKYKLNYCRSLMHGVGLLDKDYNKEQLKSIKEKFYHLHGYSPKVALALGVVIGETLEEARHRNEALTGPLDTTRADSLVAIPVTIEYLGELVYRYQCAYGIDEFILYDMEGDNLRKMENIKQISRLFNLSR
ncbi:LLM class flavin-dependent oxidoreductase [Chitinophaga sp. 22321]|uniref:LLM class flavin-dependent oxidoreductase n=1 Tax=Chitinophaga hostae TaxID=2831022 RepID=A0ABS5IRZ1_9BACT|nr:LLM class flavin-dependent oxidoreductase [Chitinophaga hostae]MBS0025730.1 LLM class flavin-dependent oxidoreductase [Chitinophaga hostae]